MGASGSQEMLSLSLSQVHVQASGQLVISMLPSCSRRDRHFYRRSIFCPGGLVEHQRLARPSPEEEEMGRSLPVARLVRPPTHA